MSDDLVETFTLHLYDGVWQVWGSNHNKPVSSENTLELALKVAYPHTGAVVLKLENPWK